MQRIGTLVALCLWAGIASAAGFTLESRNIQANAKIPNQYAYNGFGCTGENVSPELHWQGAPSGTKSFAITVYDPDAPTGSGWWHWVVYNLPANTHELPAGASGKDMPKGASEGRTDFGSHGYGGPCPPQGAKPHHYHFTVYALDVPSLDLPKEASPAMVGFNLHFHTLAKAELTALYGR